jgi:hypothetical protein
VDANEDHATGSLYVNGADRSSLTVNDLKLGDVHGPVALWTGSDTEAYFLNPKYSVTRNRTEFGNFLIVRIGRDFPSRGS